MRNARLERVERAIGWLAVLLASLPGATACGDAREAAVRERVSPFVGTWLGVLDLPEGRFRIALNIITCSSMRRPDRRMSTRRSPRRSRLTS
jgi:hypothetical protein